MLIKNPEKPRKRILRERIYEEVVHLILSSRLPSGGWVDDKQVIGRLQVSRTRSARRSGYWQTGRDQAQSRLFMCAVFSATRPRIWSRVACSGIAKRGFGAQPPTPAVHLLLSPRYGNSKGSFRATRTTDILEREQS
jgi:hypothetical protein